MTESEKESPAAIPIFSLFLVFVSFFLYIAFKQSNQISIANLSLLFGVFFAVISSYAIAKPKDIGRVLVAFPRANAPGYLFMLASTLWFLWNIKNENMADYRDIKHWFYLGFGVVGIGSCFYLKDFLAVRGLAVFMLLVAKLVLDTQRVYMFSTPEELVSEWRLIFPVFSYSVIVMAMWMVISPWRMRNVINWIVSDPSRISANSIFFLLFGVLLIVLSFTVF